jgi:putative ABC transport system substrate-binding protein
LPHRRRTFLAALGGAAVARPLAAAQQPTGIPRIGVLMGANPTVEAARQGTFRGALERLGYSDGQTILIELRYAEGHIDRFDGLARELVALAPSVIACVGTPETRALQAATRSIPCLCKPRIPSSWVSSSAWRGRAATPLGSA